ncbi:MAG TPA: dihydrofolate reductase family protein, partial [Pyrinomonadaceae bacterium]|nr:dihydrofolate reductase family protein [Pyrinomonadaceae bacterium]
LSVDPGSQLIATANETPLMVYCGEHAEPEKIKTLRHSGVDVCNHIDSRSLLSVLSNLGDRSIQSVLVEGGASVAGALFDAGLVNKISFFLAPMIIGGGEAPGAIAGQGAERLSSAWKLKEVEIHRRGDDLEITGYPENDN